MYALRCATVLLYCLARVCALCERTDDGQSGTAAPLPQIGGKDFDPIQEREEKGQHNLEHADE
jgi:hypothetical protein